MKDRIVNFLSWFKKLNKRTLSVLLFFVFLGLFLPLYSIQAFPLATQIANALVGITLSLFFFASIALLKLSVGILNWIVTGGFTTFAYTHNDFVTPAWEMMRDFANIFFVIILIVIGLATSLRLREYEAKKILPLFIIIALLINFTPVITGLIIDASNIIMNTFLQATSDFTNFSSLFSRTIGNIEKNFFDYLMEVLVVVIFNVISSVVFFLFASLFAFRYIAIWTLVILSPLAFACYILPATRKIFTQWWDTFLQWCFIGVTASLFLYLGQQVLSVLSNPLNSPGSVDIPGGTSFITETINNILPYGISLIFFILGFYAAFSTGAMGASQVISGTKRGAGWVGRRRPVQLAAGKVAGWTARRITEARIGTEKIEKRLEELPGGGALKHTAKPFIWLTRGTESLTSPYLREKSAELRRFRPPKEWDQMSIQEKEGYIESLGPTRESDKLTLMSKMKEEKSLQSASKDFKKRASDMAERYKENLIYRKDVRNIFNTFPNRLTADSKIDYELATIKSVEEKEKERKKWNDNINNTIEEYNLIDIDKNNTARDQAARILHMRSFKSQDIKEMDKSAINSEEFRIATHGMSSSHLQVLKNSFDEETVHNVLYQKGGLNTVDKETLIKINDKNPQLVNWAYNTQAGKSMLDWSDKSDKFKLSDLKKTAGKRNKTTKKPPKASKPKEKTEIEKKLNKRYEEKKREMIKRVKNKGIDVKKKFIKNKEKKEIKRSSPTKKTTKTVIRKTKKPKAEEIKTKEIEDIKKIKDIEETEKVYNESLKEYQRLKKLKEETKIDPFKEGDLRQLGRTIKTLKMMVEKDKEKVKELKKKLEK